MKITRISVYQKDLPLADPYRLSGGRLKFEVLDATFVKLDTDAGLTGWGEGTPWGHTYVPAHGPGIRAGIETMAPIILGQDPRKVELVERAMDLCLPGHLYAKVGGNVDADIERIRHLEANRRPGEIILYDVNRAWTRREASIVMNAVADLGVTFEQPGETLDDIAEIRKVTTSPISVDETLVTLQDACRIARDGIADVFGIKLNRVGGLTKARRMRDVALAHGIQMFVMATGGSVMADTEAAHLAQSIPEEFIRTSWSCQDMLTVDVAPGRGCRTENGFLTVDDTPGLGCDPDETILRDPVAVYE